MISALLESTSQKILSTDPETLNRLSILEDKLIAIDIKKLERSLYLRIENQNIIFQTAPESAEDVDVRLKAKPSTLFKISRDGMENAKLEKGELEIEGDAIIGQRFANVMNSIDIDWEELLAEKVGDTPARLLFDLFAKAQHWHKDTRQAMKQNLSEFLVEEAQIVAHSSQVDSFVEKVDALRNDTARLEARLNQTLLKHSSKL